MKLSYSLLLSAFVLILLILLIPVIKTIRTNRNISEIKELCELSKGPTENMITNLTAQHKKILAQNSRVSDQKVEIEESSSTLNFDYDNSRIYKYDVTYRFDCPVSETKLYDRVKGTIKIIDDSSKQSGLSLITAELHFQGNNDEKTLSFYMNNRGDKSVSINKIDCTEAMDDYINSLAAEYMNISKKLLSP